MTMPLREVSRSSPALPPEWHHSGLTLCLQRNGAVILCKREVCDSKNRAFNHRETLLIKNMFWNFSHNRNHAKILILTSFFTRVFGEGWGARWWAGRKMWWVIGWMVGTDASYTFVIRRPPHQLLKMTVHTDREEIKGYDQTQDHF